MGVATGEVSKKGVGAGVSELPIPQFTPSYHPLPFLYGRILFSFLLVPANLDILVE